MVNSENISIAIFEIELQNKSIVTIKGYNETADFCYSKLVKGDIVGILGEINSNMKIEIQEIELQ